MIGPKRKVHEFRLFWEPVDPVVADPVRQDNDKRNNIQIYTRKFPIKVHRGGGTKLPNIHFLSLSCRTGSPTTGSAGSRLFCVNSGVFPWENKRDSRIGLLFRFAPGLDGKIANRQSLAILDRGLKSQPFSQFCCIGICLKRIANRAFRIAASNRRDASDSNRAFLNR